MFDLILIGIALALGTGGAGAGGAGAGGTGAGGAGGTATAAAEAGSSGPVADPVANPVAEPQVATGKFTTALEVRPILAATRGNWVGVREYEGQDLVYVTHLLAWRCGLLRLRYAINDGPMQDWPLPPCQSDTAQPNAIPQDARIYETHPLKSVRTITVELTYDDLATDQARFERGAVLIP